MGRKPTKKKANHSSRGKSGKSRGEKKSEARSADYDSGIRDEDGLPPREDILKFIKTAGSTVGKREISRAFSIKGDTRKAFKRLLKEMTDEGHALMKERVEALKVACENADLPAIVKGDMEFHSGIIELSENEELFNLWKPIIAGMMLHYDRHRGDWMVSYHEHKQILDAIIAGDRKTAKAALKANIK